MDILLFNPNAGAAKRLGLTEEELLAKLAEKGIRAQAPHLSSEEGALDVAVKASGRVIVAGGDGTIHQLLMAAGACGILKLAIIPLGTANHLAGALGIPSDLDAAIDVIAAGHSRKIDLGKVNGDVFSQAAGVGLHARVFHAYGEHKEKSKIDAVTAGVTTFADWNPQPVRLVIDGQPYMEEVTQVTCANTPSYGARFTIAPDARIDDGLLDVVILGNLSKVEIIRYGLAMVSGTVEDLPKAYTTRAKRVEITSMDQPVEVHADAKPVGFTPAVIEVLPGCLEVVVPEESI